MRAVRFISAMSAVGVALSVTMWVRSHSRLESISWIPAAHSYSICTDRGEIGVMWWRKFVNGYHDGRHWVGYSVPAATQADGSRYGTYVHFADRGWIVRWSGRFSASPSVVVVVPLWLITLCAGSPLLVNWIRRWRRATDDPTGRCRTCGYDLRATPDRCPECGAAA